MVNDTVDLLEIKIQEAKASLPTETVNAIAVVDWKTAILSLRSKYGYTFEQLGDLELETELLLCGLTSAENYPKELMNRIKISETATNELVNEMNNLVFKKIREELIKNTERKKIFVKSSPPLLSEEGAGGGDSKERANTEIHTDTHVLKSAGIEIIHDLSAVPSAQLMQTGKLEIERAHPILTQKLSSTVQTPVVKTEHAIENITRTSSEIKEPVSETPKSYPKNADPYRLPPEA
ncbi:hypothetical protein A2643_00395 [Candidatus Nomurabacteria bacterium RIFCSPHIGHO2_01_FULL_39_220]|uniref:Uncharacterized protein n=1 Tax=Candidatus Nomurabacteria bacterium RIFCSPLOWO2_02_FULL_40_67 TaxID=1801787 RepID=A0A1F6Y404_9BACT|nr:MAG: hypothetical protein UU01_C0009G0023 [Parcubacteria group bacterium GW2011_GWA2_40_37]OGI62022.1 MAG: hypothetical protein A2W12_01535 [Candidatus Nomurabacteria bacterium RBG_16_40_11]OGI70235.1 MAG: hypothetical protein A2643_00395 [Candidatus Nomurabacteria bacterium RIFCSPHIGHO2_01_FULL_39_220]OGI72095.1 MAG: hypothetical protein A2W56_03880 [Candidatus Nomurabacteria bacterium RIFCSPHIGHO2_02_41_18]OGI78707.1 MAG: hypothetical protein A3C65_01925 [Candidatus Nomurabacteria bacteriu